MLHYIMRHYVLNFAEIYVQLSLYHFYECLLVYCILIQDLQTNGRMINYDNYSNFIKVHESALFG